MFFAGAADQLELFQDKERDGAWYINARLCGTATATATAHTDGGATAAAATASAGDGLAADEEGSYSMTGAKHGRRVSTLL